MQKLQLVEQEREINAARQEAPTREYALTPTANLKDEEVLAPVNDVFELLIVEPEGSDKQGPFVVSVPSNAVGARLRATIDQYTATIRMGGHMVYEGSIIQDNVALAQGYGIQDQCDIFIFPRGDLPPWTDGCATFVDPEFHALPASSSSVKAIDEKTKGVRETAYREATPDSRAAQPLFAEEEGKSSVGRGMGPSGFLTLPKPLLAGDSDKPPPAAAMPILEPVSPTKPTTG